MITWQLRSTFLQLLPTILYNRSLKHNRSPFYEFIHCFIHDIPDQPNNCHLDTGIFSECACTTDWQKKTLYHLFTGLKHDTTFLSNFIICHTCRISAASKTACITDQNPNLHSVRRFGHSPVVSLVVAVVIALIYCDFLETKYNWRDWNATNKLQHVTVIFQNTLTYDFHEGRKLMSLVGTACHTIQAIWIKRLWSLWFHSLHMSSIDQMNYSPL